MDGQPLTSGRICLRIKFGQLSKNSGHHHLKFHLNDGLRRKARSSSEGASRITRSDVKLEFIGEREFRLIL